MKKIDDKFEFIDTDFAQWNNLLSVLPFFKIDKGVIYILYRGNEIINAVHSQHGQMLDLIGTFSSPEDTARELQEREEVDAVVMLEHDLSSYLLAKIQAMFDPESDILDFLGLVQKGLEEEKGIRFHVWPPEFWTLSGLVLLNSLVGLLNSLPNDALCLMVIFREQEIWTSLIAEINDGILKRITTTKVLEPFTTQITDYHEDYHKLIDRMTQVIGHPTIGFFTDAETFLFLLRSSSPLEYIRQAYHTGQIILDPLPSSLERRL
ncbi:MAG: hypothetical protein ACFFDP_03215 [Promethearchaeota archaeon]